MEAQGFIGQEGKLGLARIILKSSREFFIESELFSEFHPVLEVSVGNLA